MMYVDTRSCDGCGLCVEACPNEAISLLHGVAGIDPERCQDTGACLEVCPQGAVLSLIEPQESKIQMVPQAAPPVATAEQTTRALAKRPSSLGAWMGAALTFLASDVLPELLRTWSSRRSRRLLDSTPLGSKAMGAGQCGGRGKPRRRRRQGRC
jgi:NAD-dependent dihydropyrimidine dehydrogenase PreA subunit